MGREGYYGTQRGLKTRHDPIEFAEGAYLLPQANVSLFDDFIDDTLETSAWAVTVEADGTDQSTCTIVEATAGTLVLELGATANDFANCAGAIVWNTSQPGIFEARVKIDSAVDNLFIGLSDAKTESNGNLGTNLTTPALVPTDGLLFGFEQANGGDLWYLCSANNGTDTATATAIAPSTSYQTLRVEWDANRTATFYIDGAEVGAITSALKADVDLCPIVASTHVSGTGDPTVTVDYVFVTQTRE